MVSAGLILAGVGAVLIVHQRSPEFPERLWMPVGPAGVPHFESAADAPDTPCTWEALDCTSKGVNGAWIVRPMPDTTGRLLERFGIQHSTFEKRPAESVNEGEAEGYYTTDFFLPGGTAGVNWQELRRTDARTAPPQAEQVAGTWEHSASDGVVHRIQIETDGRVTGFPYPNSEARWGRHQDRIAIIVDPTGHGSFSIASEIRTIVYFDAVLDTQRQSYSGHDTSGAAVRGRRVK